MREHIQGRTAALVKVRKPIPRHAAVPAQWQIDIAVAQTSQLTGSYDLPSLESLAHMAADKADGEEARIILHGGQEFFSFLRLPAKWFFAEDIQSSGFSGINGFRMAVSRCGDN